MAAAVEGGEDAARAARGCNAQLLDRVPPVRLRYRGSRDRRQSLTRNRTLQRKPAEQRVDPARSDRQPPPGELDPERGAAVARVDPDTGNRIPTGRFTDD